MHNSVYEFTALSHWLSSSKSFWGWRWAGTPKQEALERRQFKAGQAKRTDCCWPGHVRLLASCALVKLGCHAQPAAFPRSRSIERVATD